MTYTDDEIREALRRARDAVGGQSSRALYPGQLVQYEQDAAILRWLATEYPRLKAERCPFVKRSADGIYFCENLNVANDAARGKEGKP